MRFTFNCSKVLALCKCCFCNSWTLVCYWHCCHKKSKLYHCTSYCEENYLSPNQDTKLHISFTGLNFELMIWLLGCCDLNWKAEFCVDEDSTTWTLCPDGTLHLDAAFHVGFHPGLQGSWFKDCSLLMF